MSIDPKQVQAAFLEAVQAAAADRPAILDRLCAADVELRRRVELLLRAHDDSADIPPAAGGTEGTNLYEIGGAAPGSDFRPGTVIAGRYKLLEEIGEGGMGTVWVAEQTQPVRRKVALKLVKPGMDSRSVLARFEAERQALAVMDHPNIAKVLDGGLTESGRPYFVMEYVKGVPITEYCETARLSIPERLQLFVAVCQAVQHAHHKGIIHRDLKPSNILVAPYDDRPVPKVIDFGLAKAMHQSLTERTLHTAHETVLGTPLYMSPEQAQLNNLDVDTRSDLYSLGVLLYELLTGSTPLEKQRFKEAAWDEVRRIIREEEPPRPSLRLSSSQMLPSLAAGRQTEPLRLTKLVRGELDWIVMKALEKDRARRYETANGFALDVERYLAGEPVLAAPPSARYRLRKFARKHRTALTTAAAIIALLVAGAAFSAWQAVRAKRAEAEALVAKQDALQAQVIAEEKQAEAVQQKNRAEAGEKLASERLTEVDAEKKKAEARRAEAERQKGRAESGEKLADDRLVQVQSLLAVRANAAAKLAAEKENVEKEKEIAQAVRDFLQNKLLGQADSRTQADALLRAGDLAAETKENPTIRELLDRAAKELSPERIEANFPNQPLVQAEILQTVGRTYLCVGECERAIGFLKRSAALYRQHLGPEHPDTLQSMNNLAAAHYSAGRLDLALPLFEETLKLRKAKLGRDHLYTLQTMNNLASAYQAAGKRNLVLPLLEEALKLSKAKLGPDHPETLIIMNNLANAYHDTGKLDLALRLYEESLKLSKAKLGSDHPTTLYFMSSLAVAYHYDGKLDLALPLYEETLKLQRVKLGPDNPETVFSMSCLAAAYQAAGKVDLALPLFEEGYRAAKKHAWSRGMGTQLLDGYVRAGKTEQAATLTKELLADARTKLPKESPQLAGQLESIALSLLQAGAFTEAEPLLQECLAIREKTEPDEWTTFSTKSRLGGALSGQEKYAEAEPLLLAGYAGMKECEAKIPPPQKARLTAALERLVQLYEALEKKDEAAKWRKELEAAKAKPPVQP